MDVGQLAHRPHQGCPSSHVCRLPMSGPQTGSSSSSSTGSISSGPSVPTVPLWMARRYSRSVGSCRAADAISAMGTPMPPAMAPEHRTPRRLPHRVGLTADRVDRRAGLRIEPLVDPYPEHRIAHAPEGTDRPHRRERHPELPGQRERDDAEDKEDVDRCQDPRDGNVTFERHPASHHDQRGEPEHECTAIEDREPPQLRELPDSRKPDVPQDVQIGQPVEALGRCSVQRGRAEDQHERRVRAHRLDPFPERGDQRPMEPLAMPVAPGVRTPLRASRSRAPRRAAAGRRPPPGSAGRGSRSRAPRPRRSRPTRPHARTDRRGGRADERPLPRPRP